MWDTPGDPRRTVRAPTWFRGRPHKKRFSAVEGMHAPDGRRLFSGRKWGRINIVKGEGGSPH